MSINCSSMLACPTCGPNCNYECENGVCVEKPRDDNRVGVSKTRGVPSKGSTDHGPRGHSMAQFQNASGAPLWFNQTSTTTAKGVELREYTNIFKEKNYWIGVAVGIAGLMAYQKYVKK